jgi:phytoene/squalene synthetase
MLDVHGESRAAWPANDALCSALQIINHLQDCARDYRELNRVYLPGDALSAAGVTVETLGEARASAALLGVIGDLAARTGELLARSDGFAGAVSDLGLSLEIGVIHRLGAANVERLRTRDPLSERVHPRPIEAVGGVLIAVAATLAARLGGSAKPQRGAIGP